MNSKPKIAIFIDWFLPAYKAGGPIVSIENMVQSLSDIYDFFIYTSNKEYSTNERILINSDCWIDHIHGCKVYYSSRAGYSDVKSVIEVINPDHIYINGLYSFKYSILPLFLFKKRSLIVSPRGMLSSGSIGIKSIKKKLFLHLMKAFQIYRDVTFHATSMHEADDIKKWFGQESQIVYISNLSRKIPKKIDIKEKVSGKLKVVFIGRIAQEKNLKYAIELINNLEGVSFDIYGPVYDKRYENECRELSFNEQQSIEFHAAIAPQDLRETISKYHVLLFPSTGENFGHVIIESLSFGLPVLISDKTPWKNLEENKAGMVIDLADRIAWLDGILFFKKLNQEEYNDWSGKAHRYALNYSNNKETLNQYMELFSI